jgi:hypothetical protein
VSWAISLMAIIGFYARRFGSAIRRKFGRADSFEIK